MLKFSHLVKFTVELVDLSLEILVLLLEVVDGEVDHVEHLHPGAARLGLTGALYGPAVVNIEVFRHWNQQLLTIQFLSPLHTRILNY